MVSDNLNITSYESASGVPIKILFDIDWGSDVGQKVVAASMRMQRWDILLRTIGRKMVESTKRGFDSMTSPEGVRWPGLKRPRGKGHNPLGMVLQDSYRLINSIGYVSDENSLHVGYGASYGQFHQQTDDAGHNLPSRWIPQRKFLGFRPGDVPESIVMQHVKVSFESGGSS